MNTDRLILGRMFYEQHIRPKKPRIRWTGFCWHCVGNGRGEFGKSPANAYTMWQVAGVPRYAVVP